MVIEHKVIGTVSGGIRVDPDTQQEITQYVLTYKPTVYFGQKGKDYVAQATPEPDGSYKNVPLTRIGEEANVTQCYLQLDWIAGVIETEILTADTLAQLPPRVNHKNSVAFDAATDAQEDTGDGVLTFSHTCSGTNRAVFIAGAARSSGTGATAFTVTYGGNAATQLWNNTGGSFTADRLQGAYVKESGAPTGAQTVSCTQTGGTSIGWNAAGAISMTGVDQTTPVGTAVITTAGTNALTVTVASVGVDDLVVDDVYTSDAGPTVGANQTERIAETNGSRWLHGSTQPGTAGGVMSWTAAGSFAQGVGAVAFKPAAGASTDLMAQICM